jgi:shikimate dehydrogenase
MKPGMLVGLIGANIQKSLSPALFEEACRTAGIRGHYHLMDLDLLPGRTLADLISAARTAGFKGVNVTYPCKEAIVPLLDDLSAEAGQIGAVNTVSIDLDGKTKGYNTDRIGFRRGFEDELGADRVRDKTALLVGAGGAGRAVAFALFDLGVRRLLVADKSADQARSLVRALTSAFGAERACAETDPEAALAKASGVVNATPVGMLGFPGNPVPAQAISADHWVADVIYTPLETELIVTARSRGSPVMGGAAMCVHQAAETFKIFTGLAADVGRMQLTFAEAAAVRERNLHTT